jgi:hypothetical protein
MVLQWCYNGVTMVLQWCYNGVTTVLEWCYNGVLQWCYLAGHDEGATDVSVLHQALAVG